MKHLLTTLVCAIMSLATIAQVNITGVVLDGETNESLIGATVFLKDTNIGTVTDFDGSFTLQNVTRGTQTLVISYVGYSDMEQMLTVTDSDVRLGELMLKSDAIGLSEVNVIASIAVDRKTPVAVSTLKAEEIEARIGNQEFPEVLRSTPSVYVTKQGGGFGDARVNVRGFDSQNTAVMINGIPVNDMENGLVYWSNWAGLSDVSNSIQIQRGLGASKLAVPSIGGSINIITRAADMDRKAIVRLNTGNDGYQKYGLMLASGLLENGWAFTAQGTHVRGDGYIDGTQFEGWSYFLSASKTFNSKHTLSLTGLGAPQWHHQRTINNFDNVYLSTYARGEGIRYNNLWGSKNGEEFSWRRNFYHKPKVFVNHYFTINEDTDLKTSAYISFGRGGGTGPRGRMTSNGTIFDSSDRTRNDDGQVLWDDIVAWNGGAEVNTDDWGTKEVDADGPFAGQYTTTSRGNGFIRRASMNLHDWYGVLSTLTHRINDKVNFVGGVDGRYYKGKHYRRVDDLLGNDAYLAKGDDNNPENYITNVNADYDEGNVINYHNDGLVTWIGLFGQVEYSNEKLTAYVNLSGSNQGFKRVDFFNYLDDDTASNDIGEDGEYQASDWQNFLGGTAKAGINYNIDARNNVFVNGGYTSRQPTFDNVFINFRNTLNEKVENQSIYSLEGGYGFRSEGFRLNVNAYHTLWGNRQFDKTRDVIINDSTIVNGLANFRGVEQLHQGLELEAAYKMSNFLSFDAMVSLGNWRYTKDFDADITNTDDNTFLGTSTIYATDVKIGDAAQTTTTIGVDVRPIDNLWFRIEGNYVDRLYADFNIADSIFETPGGQAVELPSYTLLDASISYKFKIGGFDVKANANVYNILGTEYIAELDTNVSDNPATSRNEFLTQNKGFYGFGRTWSAGLKFTF